MMLKMKNKIGNEMRKNLSILQYSSANCRASRMALAADWRSCTSYLKLSLQTIFVLNRCVAETYRCFLNRMAAYLKNKKTIRKLIEQIRILKN